MGSADKLSTAVEAGVISNELIHGALGKLGTGAAEALQQAEATHTPNYIPALIGFNGAFASSRQACIDFYKEYIPSDIPTMEAFEAVGYDIAMLATSYDYALGKGLQPEVILAPQLTFHEAIEFVGNFASSSHLLNNQPLLVSDDIGSQDAWKRLSFLRSANRPILEGKYGINWTLGILPGCSLPLYRGESHSTLEKLKLPTISELLALHYQRLQLGKAPVDSEYWSWAKAAKNDIDDPAPAVRWNPTTKQIEVCYFTRGNNGRPDAGTRPVMGYGDRI